MSQHACTCDHGGLVPERVVGRPHGLQVPAPWAPVTPDETVGAVARRSYRAREVMDRLGLNHCCGAHLTLAEAAAAAGLSVDGVMRALNEALAGAL
jgi:hypothetical protein